jgi:hypothetical protein
VKEKKSYAKPHFLQTGSPFGVQMLLFFFLGGGGGFSISAYVENAKTSNTELITFQFGKSRSVGNCFS